MKIKLGEYFTRVRNDGTIGIYQTIKSLKQHTVLVEIVENKRVFANRSTFLRGREVRLVTEREAKKLAECLRKEEK